MTKVFLGLTSREGDRLGHLVRAVQMLRSYGSETELVGYSDVYNVATKADEPPALCCLFECSSTATLEGLRGICRETLWALGDQPQTLSLTLLQFGAELFPNQPEPLLAILRGKPTPGMAVFMTRHEFAKICDWGQVLPDGDADIMGEWPSATGR